MYDLAARCMLKSRDVIFINEGGDTNAQIAELGSTVLLDFSEVQGSSQPVSSYNRQLVRLNNMPVMGSSPKWTVPPYVGLTILLWGVIHKSLKAKPTSGTGRP